jgi:diguanylate cyclase (GGDEF)-like protein/putative nucleotidyltransferase with HDIG domain
MTQLSLWLTASMLLVSAVVSLAYWKLRHALREERTRADRIQRLHVATMEALALAIEAKDHTSHHHIRRVQVYSTGLARALGMSPADVEAVTTAALLHDIGMLAVPEHILAKPGPLTPEEAQKVRIHPAIGAEIIASIPFPAPVAPLILGHHERWDGRGYPRGQKGEQIPLGARVLGIAEYYDALTSDRPYHKAMPADAAEALLRKEAGHAFEPRIVDAFTAVLPELRAEAARAEVDAPSFLRPVRDVFPDSADMPPDRTARSVFADIAVAHREIYALYEIAQTMGTSLGVSDTMSLIAPPLEGLVPYSACALFLYSPDDEVLHCRFSTGVDAELMNGTSIKSGQGLTGWVARNRRPLVNARPQADLEVFVGTPETSLQSALVCPLTLGEQLIGTIAVYHTEPSFYRDDHRRLLDRVCEQAAAVIHNAIVYEQTHEAAVTDPLTGLPNTRYMFMHLTRELARAERLGSEVSILVIDLNDFKEINDTYGHQTGDRALREVAHVLKTTIRPYDICVRYAGDEFIVVLAGCGQDEAENKRLELVQAVEDLVFEARVGQAIGLSISAGGAVFPHDGDTYEALVAKADSRMYFDKSMRKSQRHLTGTWKKGISA